MRIRTLLHAALVVFILALCGKIVSTWRRPLPAPSGEAPNASPPLPGPGELPSGLTPDAMSASVDAIAQNDLFSPNRGAVTPQTTTVEGPPKVDPPSHLKLVGVILTRSRAEAFLSDASQGNKVLRVKQGESIGQYQLLQVTAAEVKLSLGAGGEVAPLQLRVLDSATSQQAPRLIPNVAQPNPGMVRPGAPAGRILQAPGADPNQQAAAQAAPEEAQALRENIQRMQQRLRRIRRRAAREEAAAQGENVAADENGDEDGGDEDE
jgi:hypothetical protein